MSYHHSLRRLAARIQQTPAQGPSLRMRLGTVASVTQGAAADGNAAATVTVGADTLPAPYLAPYAPVAGDAVMVLLVNSSPLILGHVIGLPVI